MIYACLEGQVGLSRLGLVSVRVEVLRAVGCGTNVRASETLLVQCNTEARTIGQVNETILGQRLIGEEAAEVGEDAVRFRGQVQELCHGTVAESILQVVRVDRAAVRDDEDVMRRGKGNDTASFSDTTQPRDIGLNNVHRLGLDQHAETVPSVLVLGAGKHDARVTQSVLDLFVPVVVVRGEELLHPFKVVRLQSLCQLDGVGHRQRHVAVQHEGEVGTNLFTPTLEELHVLAESFVTGGGTVRAGHLQICTREDVLDVFWIRIALSDVLHVSICSACFGVFVVLCWVEHAVVTNGDSCIWVW
jgi:hypothetical protein